MTLSNSLRDREYAKFRQLGNGSTAVAVSLVSGIDIEIGAVELKGATNDYRVDVQLDNGVAIGSPMFMPIGGIYNASGVTYSDGDASVAQFDAHGYLKTTFNTPFANYKSPSDFTATYTSSTTITLTGVPFTPTSEEIAYIKVIPSSGDAEVFVNGRDGVTMTISSNIITISGAGSPFASGDSYEVGINHQDKAYDSSLDVIKSIDQSPIWSRNTDVESLISSAQDLSTSFADLGAEVDVIGYKKAFFWITVDINLDTDVRFKIYGKHTSGGSEEYPLSDSLVTVHTDNTYSSAAANRYFELNDDADQLVLVEVDVSNGIKYLQFQVSAGSHTDGQISAAYVTKGY